MSYRPNPMSSIRTTRDGVREHQRTVVSTMPMSALPLPNTKAPATPPGYPVGMPVVPGPQLCDECGTILVRGPEPIDPDEGLEDEEVGEHYRLVDWCPNLDCPSNHALSRVGLRQVGANQYVCTVCGLELSGPPKQYLGHHLTHRAPSVPDQP